jgi:hypothetical protein
MFINFINNCKTAKYNFINTMLILNIKLELFLNFIFLSLIVIDFSFKNMYFLYHNR